MVPRIGFGYGTIWVKIIELMNVGEIRFFFFLFISKVVQARKKIENLLNWSNQQIKILFLLIC